MSAEKYYQNFVGFVDELTYSKRRFEVFSDFLRLASLSLLQSYWFTDDREQEYLAVAGGYSRDELEIFARMIGTVVMALDGQFQDFLGVCFHRLELHEKYHGQFFTPYDVSRMIARMQLPEHEPAGIQRVYEPAAGSGGMLVALCEEWRNRGWDYQRNVYVDAMDLSEDAFRMCYIQLNVIGAPGIIRWGNTITLEQFAAYPTVGYFQQRMQERLRETPESKVIQPSQMSLFAGHEPKEQESSINRKAAT